MSLLPWDKWFYPGIDKYKHKLSDLKNRYGAQRKMAERKHDEFQSDLELYKSMLAYDAALMITGTVAYMTDDQFADYAKSVAKGIGPTPKAPVPAECARNLSEAFGSCKILYGIYQIGKLAKSSFFSGPADELGQGLATDSATLGTDAASLGMSEAGGEVAGEAVGEAVGEVAAEGAADTALASTGIGIIAAFGLDAIIGAIEGAKEEKELKKACEKMDSVLGKIDRYLGKVNKGIDQLGKGVVVQEERFKRLMNQLQKVQKAEFSWNYPCDVHHAASMVAAMRTACQQYGFLVTIRTDWLNMREHQPNLTWQSFTQIELLKRPQHMSEHAAKGLLEVIEKNLKSKTPTAA